MNRFYMSNRIIPYVLSAAEEHIFLLISRPPLLTLHCTLYQLAIAAIKQPHADGMNFVVQLVS